MDSSGQTNRIGSKIRFASAKAQPHYVGKLMLSKKAYIIPYPNRLPCFEGIRTYALRSEVYNPQFAL